MAPAESASTPPDAPLELALIDPAVLEAVLTEQVGRHAAPDIFAHYEDAVAAQHAAGDPLLGLCRVAEAARDAYTRARMEVIAHMVRAAYPTATALTASTGRHTAGWQVVNPRKVLDGERVLWDFDHDGFFAGFATLTLNLSDVHFDAGRESLGVLRWLPEDGGVLHIPLPSPPDPR